MMNKKTKRLYGRMQHGLQKKKDEVEALKAKRKNLDIVTPTESAGAKSSSAKKNKKRRT